MSLIPLTEVRAAAERLAGALHRTPTMPCHALGEAAGVELLLKCELFQKTGSFKPRGALNIVLSLGEQERAAGLCTVSAGNHAQAVAWAARRAGVPCTVVMPAGAVASKVDAVQGYGGTVVFHDDNATLFDRVRALQEESGAAFVHPFDDPIGLAGAATLGLEIAEDVPDVEAVLVPLGGGGLMAGVTSAIKALHPDCRVVAVEIAEGPGMLPALEAGEPVTVERPMGTLADGLIPPFVGKIPFQIARDHVDEIVTVTEAQVRDAMAALMTRAKLFVEGSGAAATAALLFGATKLDAGTRVVSVVSGGNVDLARLARAFGEDPT